MKKIFLFLLCFLIFIYQFVFSSCSESQESSNALNSSYESSIIETQETTSFCNTTHDTDCEYIIQIIDEKTKNIIESILPTIYKMEQTNDEKEKTNNREKIINEIISKEKEIQKISASSNIVLMSGENQIKIYGIWIYTIEGVLYDTFAFNQLPELQNGSYYAIIDLNDEGVYLCFEVLQENEPTKVYFNYEDAKKEKSFIVQGDNIIETNAIIDNYNALIKGYTISGETLMGEKQLIDYYINKQGEPPIVYSKNGTIELFGGDIRIKTIKIFDIEKEEINGEYGFTTNNLYNLENGEYYFIFWWSKNGRELFLEKEQFTFFAVFKFIVE